MVSATMRIGMIAAFFATLCCGTSSDDRLKRLSSGDPGVRLAAVVAVAKAKDASAVDALVERMQSDEDLEIRKFAARGLGIIGDRRATPALLKIVTSNEPVELRGYAVNALGAMADPESILGMIAVWELDAENKDNGVIQAGVRFTLNDLKALSYEPLIGALSDPHPAVRGAAADTLALIGDKRAIEAISPLIADPDPSVRNEAKYALEKLAER